MSSSNDDIRVRIAGDLADIRRSMQDLKKQARDAGRVAKQSRSDWLQLGRGLDRVRRQVKNLVGAYLGFRAIQSTIGAVIRNTVEQERVTAQLEARLKSTKGAAGLTAEELFGMAEGLQDVTTFGDEAIIAMQGVLLTFTQIRGDVFEEATERILDMSTVLGRDLQSSALQVGKALNDPIKGISQLVEAGVNLSPQQQALVRGFIEIGDVVSAQRVLLAELDTQFGDSARAARDTFGGALQSLKNAFGDLLEGRGGSLDNAKDAINELTELLRDEKTIRAFAAFTTGIIETITVMVDLITTLEALKQQFRDSFSDTPIEEAAERLAFVRKQIEQLQDLPGQQRIVELWREEEQQLLRLVSAYKQVEKGRKDADDAAPDAAAAVPTVSVDPRIALRTLQSQLASAGILLKDELDRLGKNLDRDFEDSLVRFGEFFKRRADLQRRAIDQELASQRTSLRLLEEEIRLIEQRGESAEKEVSERAKLVASITVLEKQRADIAVAAARSQVEAERELADRLADVRTRLQEVQGDAVGARAVELEQEFRDLLARLQVEGDTEGEALVRRLIDVELAKARFEELETEFQRSLASLTREEQRVQALIDTGTISEREGRRRIIELHQATADEVRELIPLMRELAAVTGDPEAIERIRELQVEVEQLASVVDRTAAQFRDSIQDAGEGAFASFITGAQDAGDAWDSFVDNVKQRAADLLAEGLFDQLFSFFQNDSGGGGIVAGVQNFLAGIFHDGGIAGQASRHRSVPAALFAPPVPRFHNGGLAVGEVPAILKRGEEVLTRDDPRHIGNLGGDRVNVYIQTQDAESFRRQSPGQIAAQVSNELRRARNRNG